MAGYSKTPLAKKLGIRDGFKIRLINEPPYYFKLFADLPDKLTILRSNKNKADFIHFFTKEIKELQKQIPALKNEIESNGMIWISWTKKASKVPTDITEDLIRKTALENGLVDIKV